MKRVVKKTGKNFGAVSFFHKSICVNKVFIYYKVFASVSKNRGKTYSTEVIFGVKQFPPIKLKI